MTEADPMAAALRLLAVRERSEQELAGRLRRKGFTEEAVDVTLRRCSELGYLDDRRFARERARTLMRNGRAVGSRVVADLRRHGIEADAASEALDEVRREIDEEDLLAETLTRRFPDFHFNDAEDRERRRVVNFFLRRGYRLSQVLSFLQTER